MSFVRRWQICLIEVFAAAHQVTGQQDKGEIGSWIAKSFLILTGLAPADEITHAAQGEVSLRQFEAIPGALQEFEALGGDLITKQVADCVRAAASHAPA